MGMQEKFELGNIQFPSEFFADEVREGFYVSSMTKRYWAAQLTVLGEIDKICRKYGIQWFADCGTLLGAVRHGGFIPWDDDMDICMLRDEYQRFFEVAREELPAEYRVLDIYYEGGHDARLGRIVNANTFDNGRERMEKYHGCPYSVGVDIFPLDGLFSDPLQEESRRERLFKIAMARDVVEKQEETDECSQELLEEIERENHTVLHREGNIKIELMLLEYQLYSLVPTREAEEVALMPFWVYDHGHNYPKALFKHTLMLPFEHTFLPVPADYDAVLKIEYGNYMEIHMGGGSHEYPAYRSQEIKFKEAMQDNLNPFRFTMSRELLDGIRKEKPWREQCFEMTDILVEAHKRIESLANRGSFEGMNALLEGCQTIAISLGTLLEKHGGESAGVVRMLEDYCELIYNSSKEWTTESKNILDHKVKEIKEGLNSFLSAHKKEILFLPYKAEWWDSMSGVWEKACREPDAEVYVVPLPYFMRNFFNEREPVKCDESDLFPLHVHVTSLSDYDIEKRHPDVVIIQFPYDEWNSCIAIPNYFCSDNLLKFTEKLVYVPCFDAREPAEEGDRAFEALKVLIEQPAVLYSDEIILKSDGMRQFYIDTLAALVGEDTREYWEKKIIVDRKERRPEQLESHDFPESWQSLMKGRKVLLYQVNVPFLLQYKETAIEKIRYTFSVIGKSGEKLVCVFSPHETIRGLGDFDADLNVKFQRVLQEVKEYENVIVDEAGEADRHIERYAGYYGNAGELAHKCRRQGIPVMIMSETGF